MGGDRPEITPGSDLRSGVFVTSPKDESVETSESASLGPRKSYLGGPLLLCRLCAPLLSGSPAGRSIKSTHLTPCCPGDLRPGPARVCTPASHCPVIWPGPPYLRITSSLNTVILRMMTVMTTTTTVGTPLTMIECAMYGLVKPSASPNPGSLHGRGHTAWLTELKHRSLPEVTVRSRQRPHCGASAVSGSQQHRREGLVGGQHPTLHSTPAQCSEPPKNECTTTFRRPRPQILACTCWPPP